MNFEALPALTEFEFNGINHKIEKLKNFGLIRTFRQCALPIMAAHFEPIERLVTASSNEFLVDWEIVTTAVGSDIKIDRLLIPAFQVILKSKGVDLPDGAVEAGLTDINYLYAIVYAQIKQERLLEYFLARRLALYQDINQFLDSPVNLQVLMSNKKIGDLLNRIKTISAEQ